MRWSNKTNQVDETTKAEEKEEKYNIEVVDNRIYFFSSITTESAHQLVLALRKTNLDLAFRQLQLGLEDPLPILLYINSPGGNLGDALAVVDEIRASRSPVTSVVTGEAASGATIISVAAHRRLIRPHAHMLIHQLSWAVWGKANEMEDGYNNLKTFMRMIKQVYKEYTKVPMKKMDEILRHDLWWGAQQCLEYGLVDEITGEE